MKPVRALLFFAFSLTASLCATAQYQWIDKNGSRVYSDVAPPADVPTKNILKQPRGSSATRAATAPAAAETAAGAGVPTPPASAASAASGPARGTGVDKALEEKKKQAEAAEAAKKQAEEQKQAQARAENCKRAREAKAGLDSGVRIARTNAKGEREVLDDTQRAAEAKRINAIIQSDCK